MESVDLSTLRVGYTEDFGVCIVGEEIRRTFRNRMSALSGLVKSCEPIDLPLTEADRTFDIMRAEAFVAAFADTLRNAPETLGPNIRANMELASSITLADRAWAHLEQTRIMRKLADAFSRYDLVLAPVVPVTPFPWTELYADQVDGQKMRNYYHWQPDRRHARHQPALSLPCGTDEHGMPFGLQVLGPLFGDGKLMAAANAIEQAFAADPTLARPRPDLTRLARRGQSCARL